MNAALREHYAAGRAAHGALALPYETFAGRVAAHAARRTSKEADPPPVPPGARLLGADLYLACACDAGIPDAWERFQALYRTRLVGLARARGLAPDAAAEAVDDLLQDLALPAPGGAARTLMGTFEGTGSLFGWLAAILVRRLIRASRRAPVAEPPGEGGAAEAPGPDPLAVALDRETRARFERALAEAWRRLTANERVAVVATHRHGLLQREIAALLGIGRPRVTRVLAAAIRRLKDAVLPALGDDVAASAGAWAELRAAVESHLARMAPAGPSGPLPSGPRAPGRHDHRNA